MTTAVREAPHHNTLTCYTNYGCRLPECVERKKAYARNRDRAMRAGTWQPLVDAAPVRDHIAKLLAAGLTEDRIATLCDAPRQSISDFTHQTRSRRGIRHSTSADFATRILAIDPAQAIPAKVDPTGTHRRIQALVAVGWPYLHIAKQLGIPAQAPEQLLRRTRIRAMSQQRIRDGYELLRDRKPTRHGVPQYKARQARERAAALRWPTPAYWDRFPGAIDDPHFEPMYGITRRELIAQDANWVMRTTGLDKTAVAERLGVSKSYVEHAFRDHPEYAIEAAA